VEVCVKRLVCECGSVCVYVSQKVAGKRHLGHDDCAFNQSENRVRMHGISFFARACVLREERRGRNERLATWLRAALGSELSVVRFSQFLHLFFPFLFDVVTSESS